MSDEKRIKRTRARVAAGDYDQPEVIDAAAERLADRVLGLPDAGPVYRRGYQHVRAIALGQPALCECEACLAARINSDGV